MLLSAFTSPVEGVLTVIVREVDGDVVVQHAGSLDLAGLEFDATTTRPALLHPPFGSLFSASGSLDRYSSPMPTTFSEFGPHRGVDPDTYELADTSAGLPFGIGNDFVFVPHGYVSGTHFSGKSTFVGETFSTLQLERGVYAAAIPNDLFVLIIGSSLSPEALNSSSTDVPDPDPQPDPDPDSGEQTDPDSGSDTGVVPKITLTADSARLNGGDINLSSGSYIDFWKGTESFPSWQIAAPVAGDYAVRILYSVDDLKAGSTYELSIGDKKLSGVVPSTGGWKNFRTLDLGVVALQSGSHSVALKALTIKNVYFMNLKEVVVGDFDSDVEASGEEQDEDSEGTDSSGSTGGTSGESQGEGKDNSDPTKDDSNLYFFAKHLPRAIDDAEEMAKYPPYDTMTLQELFNAPAEIRIKDSSPVLDAYIDPATGKPTDQFTEYSKDKYGGIITEHSRNGTGFFRTEKIDGKWRLLTPEGNLFFNMGVTGFAYYGRSWAISDDPDAFQAYDDARVLGIGRDKPWDRLRNGQLSFSLLLYNAWKKWGDNYQDELLRYQQETLARIGYNSRGAFSGRGDFGDEPNVPKAPVRTLQRWMVEGGTQIRKLAPELIDQDSYPRNYIPYDYRDPEFPEVARKWAQENLTPLKGNKYIIGVFINNEMPWFRVKDRQLRNEMAERYYRVMSEAFKEVLPNHLNLGDRIWGVEALVAREREDWDLFEIQAKYVDVVSLNLYMHLTADAMRKLASLDKPLMIGEWAVFTRDAPSRRKSYKPNAYQDPYYTQPDNQHERGLNWKMQMAEFFNSGFVGIHWFQVNDFSRATDPGANEGNYGMFSDQAEIYHDFGAHIEEFNKRMYDIMLGKLLYKPDPNVTHTSSDLYGLLKQFVWVEGWKPSAIPGNGNPGYLSDYIQKPFLSGRLRSAAGPSWGKAQAGWIEYEFKGYEMEEGLLYLRYMADGDYDIDVLLNGTKVGTITCSATGGGSSWTNRTAFSMASIGPVADGVHTLRFVAQDPFADGRGVAIDGFFVSHRNLHIVNEINSLGQITAPQYLPPEE
ncbi:hypothetical protein IEN85_16905 [Pelagicoccus sp. NFK12]|uniref:CBM6 domain-containing protein n=1 Tax=Pelagicoccus enzymogenes TaxID=2773457 RepID=A0A927IGG8_9BACT|nr:hypothetical protein [Pelagicoccus enzymogenes]MBD5781182.1 hypothetical protein [Pelagicoccus enzymogenes]